MQLNELMLKRNIALSEDEKNLIRWIVNKASNHQGASAGEITAYKFLRSITDKDTVNMADALQYLEFHNICSLLLIQAGGIPLSDFWIDDTESEV